MITHTHTHTQSTNASIRKHMEREAYERFQGFAWSSVEFYHFEPFLNSWSLIKSQGSCIQRFSFEVCVTARQVPHLKSLASVRYWRSDWPSRAMDKQGWDTRPWREPPTSELSRRLLSYQASALGCLRFFQKPAGPSEMEVPWTEWINFVNGSQNETLFKPQAFAS